MLNQRNTMSYYGKSEYFRHLRIERLDGDVTRVFPDHPRTVRTLPFTVVTCQERLEGIPYHGSSCLFDEEEEIHAEGPSCWVIPAGVRHRFLALDEGHLSIWGHFNFFLEPNWNILQFYRVPRLLEGEIRERICALVRILAENRHETLPEVCRLKRAEFELLELILEQSEPRLGLQNFRTAYLDFLPLVAGEKVPESVRHLHRPFSAEQPSGGSGQTAARRLGQLCGSGRRDRIRQSVCLQQGIPEGVSALAAGVPPDPRRMTRLRHGRESRMGLPQFRPPCRT